MPDTASPGTVHDAETAQLLHSTSPVSESVAAGGLRPRRRLGAERCDPACAVAAVVTHPEDVDPVGRRARVDLEVNRLALVDADVCREALDSAVARAARSPRPAGGLPGLQFSATISFGGEEQVGHAASGAMLAMIAIPPSAASTATWILQRLVAEAARTSFDLQKSISVTSSNGGRGPSRTRPQQIFVEVTLLTSMKLDIRFDLRSRMRSSPRSRRGTSSTMSPLEQSTPSPSCRRM